MTNDIAIGLRRSLEAAEKSKLALSQKEEKPVKNKKNKKELKSSDREGKDELNLADLGVLEEKRTVSRKTLNEGIIRPRLNEIFTMIGMEIAMLESRIHLQTLTATTCSQGLLQGIIL